MGLDAPDVRCEANACPVTATFARSAGPLFLWKAHVIQIVFKIQPKTYVNALDTPPEIKEAFHAFQLEAQANRRSF